MNLTRIGAVLAAVVLAVGLGSTHAAPHQLRIKDFDTGIITDVRLDHILTFTVKGRVREKHLGFDHFPISGVGGPGNPRGTFTRGRPLVDPLTGTVVTIDPDEFSAAVIRKVERRGRIDLIPLTRRYDTGAASQLQGRRMALIDRTRKTRKQVSFIPDLPVLPDLSDAAFHTGLPYLIDTQGRRPFHAAFLVVAADDPHLFIGTTAEGRPRIVYSEPREDEVMPTSDVQIRLRFSHPLDPRTTGGQQSVFLDVPSIAGRPGIPVSTELRQTLLGTVELIVTPEQPLPPGQYFELTLTTDLTDLPGAPIAPATTLTFSTGEFALPADPVTESFETDDGEDAAATDADWNGAVPGALVAGDGSTTARSLWYDAGSVSPNYGTPVVDLDAGGGAIGIQVQGSRENVMEAGAQPVDPDADPWRINCTDWVTLDQVDALDNYQYLRFRVVFTGGDPAPVVRSLDIPVSADRDEPGR